MTDTEIKLNACYEYVRKQTDFRPRVALVLGSGLGGFADEMKVEGVVDYRDIYGFPQSTVTGHMGRFVFGYVGGVPVAAMQGRVHYYEGYPMSDVVLPLRMLRMMGAETLFLTNAAGGINESFRPGDFMVIRDHIACLVPSPLIGENPEALGTRFPDMSNVYDPLLRGLIHNTAKSLGISTREGVYIQTTGPQYETPAEIKMYRGWGADAVGMSTACEAVAAKHCGYRVCGVSCISNLAAGMTLKELSHAEVKETAALVCADFVRLVGSVISKM